MTIFLVFTTIAWLATACMAMLLYVSIQPGQWLDKLLNWQALLHKWDLQGKELLVKAGGMCELCFSHFISSLSYWLYLFFTSHTIHYWITVPVESAVAVVIVNITWYLAYVAVGTNLSLFFITRLFRQ